MEVKDNQAAQETQKAPPQIGAIPIVELPAKSETETSAEEKTDAQLRPEG
jgi:hypothetical protein